MRLHTSNLMFRLAGTAISLGFLGFGIFAVAVHGQAPTAAIQDRTLWLGITCTIAGVSATLVTWLVEDLSNIWCKPPRRDFHDRG